MSVYVGVMRKVFPVIVSNGQGLGESVFEGFRGG
jgi:hypothetical protein